jgi:hypothetical protein
MPCHAIGREDHTPSAQFNPQSGVYVDFGGSQDRLSFYDLGVRLGAFPTWFDALAPLAKFAGLYQILIFVLQYY